MAKTLSAALHRVKLPPMTNTPNTLADAVADHVSADETITPPGGVPLSDVVAAVVEEKIPAARQSPPNRLLRYFAFGHLPAHLQAVSRPFHDAAQALAALDVVDEAERTVALRKLLEAKDAAVRSVVPAR